MKKYFICLFIVIFCIFLICSVKAIQNEPQFVEGYSRDLPYTYSTGGAFYVNGTQCGYRCDKFGRNCEKGICNPKDCGAKKGYTRVSSTGNGLVYKAVCLNPTTNMSYSVFSEYNHTEFFINNILCGEDCDIDGKNCKWGVCNDANCDIEHGFVLTNIDEKGVYGPTTSKWVCHNIDKQLSYFKSHHDKIFYYNKYKCGYNCDINGKNCKYDSGYDEIGICNPEDCPKGYTPHAGYCKKNNGSKLLYKDKDGKFRNESLRSTLHDANMFVHFAGWLLIPWNHY